MYEPKHAKPWAPSRPYKHTAVAKLAEPPRSKWSIYWLFWFFGMVVTGFVIPELHALLNKQKGDTLSENIREWLKTDTPGGGWNWLAVWSALIGILIWLGPHILQVAGWPLTGGM